MKCGNSGNVTVTADTYITVIKQFKYFMFLETQISRFTRIYPDIRIIYNKM